MKTKIAVGDSVCFTRAVIQRCGHSENTVSMRGTVTAIVCQGKVAELDVLGEAKSYPVANLVRVGAELP